MRFRISEYVSKKKIPAVLQPCLQRRACIDRSHSLILCVHNFKNSFTYGRYYFMWRSHHKKYVPQRQGILLKMAALYALVCCVVFILNPHEFTNKNNIQIKSYIF